MADQKITDFTSMTEGALDGTVDVIPIVDVSLPLDKKITPTTLFTAMLKSPPPIGTTTPGTGAFSTLTVGSFPAGSAATPGVQVGSSANGLFSSSSTQLDFSVNGVKQASVVYVANAVNSLSMFGGAAGSGPTMYADGLDAAVNYNHSLKGAGSHVFYTGSTSAVQVVFKHTASTANFVSLTGGTTGNPVNIATDGEANCSINVTPAGSGLVQINSDSVRVVTSKTPASAAATGTAGQIAWDSNYIYVCVAANTWKRSAISTW